MSNGISPDPTIVGEDERVDRSFSYAPPVARDMIPTAMSASSASYTVAGREDERADGSTSYHLPRPTAMRPAPSTENVPGSTNGDVLPASAESDEPITMAPFRHNPRKAAYFGYTMDDEQGAARPDTPRPDTPNPRWSIQGIAFEDDRRYSRQASKKPEIKSLATALPATEELYAIPIKEKRARKRGGGSAWLQPVPETSDDVLVAIPEVEREKDKVMAFRDVVKTVSSYMSRRDKILLVLSALCACLGGGFLPVMPIIFSRFATAFLEPGHTVVNSVLDNYTLYYVYLFCAELVVVFFATWGITRIGERTTRKIREAYFAALLRQELDYFSHIGVGECSGRLTEDINTIQRGITEKVARTIHASCTFLSAFVVALVFSPLLAVELFWSIGAGLIVIGLGVYTSLKFNPKIMDLNSEGLSLAEEAISSIRNVKAMGAESKLALKYADLVQENRKMGRIQKFLQGISLGLTITINYLVLAYILWRGPPLIAQDKATFTDIFVIFICMTQAVYAFIGISNHIETFSKAVTAAKKVSQTIHRFSKFDSLSTEGGIVNPWRGNILLENLSFYYPGRPNVLVLQDINVSFPAGQTTALVGASGSGKSSIIDLISRFFDPQKGHVLLDSISLDSLNLRWLRSQIGAVTQNPILFNTSIIENIRFGLIGSRYESATEEEQFQRIFYAVKVANAEDFINQLPGGYDYQVGARGYKLSGGQRQRIAIARAIVGDPKILLLDEATSAIDSESEKKIVSSLEEDKAGRTTIVVAHRLSTIKNADKIVVLEKGRVVEQGNHAELMYQRGAYWTMVEAGKAKDKTSVAEHFGNRKMSDGSNKSPELSTPPQPIASSSRTDSPWQQNRRFSVSSGGSLQLPNPFRTPHDSQSRLAASNTQSARGSDVEMDDLTANGVRRHAQDAAPEPAKHSIWSLITFVRTFSEDRCLIITGFVLCILTGAEEAVNAVLFGESAISLSLPRDQSTEMLSQVAKWAYVYLGFAILQLIFYGGQAVTLGIASENMITRAKSSTFWLILKQDVSFYDASPSSVSTMVSLLSSEVVHMCGLSGANLGRLLVVVCTLVSAIGVGLGFGWKLALVCTGTIPIILGCGFYTISLLGKHSAATSRELLVAANKATEAITDIRTVATLSMERKVLKDYCDTLGALEKKNFWRVLGLALVYAVCQAVIFLCMALPFWYGGKLIASGEYDAFQFFVVFTSIVFGSRSAGAFYSFADDIARAREGAQKVKDLHDRDILFDIGNARGIRTLPNPTGSIQIDNVSFRYPGQERYVLDNVSISALPRERIALVGPSGCGKSSLIGLLERFYNPESGTISFDGEDISSLHLSLYRQQIALVSQDIVLYNGTIRENIMLGYNEKLRGPVTESRMNRALLCANLRAFVDGLPNGLNTMIGRKGCMLSGGQKQRIAIARAMLRRPYLLLLDEATSALDAESERSVQNALDKASETCTTITIAHRLSTIRYSNKIYFMEKGRIVEEGNHEQLMAIEGGKYRAFVELQEMEAEKPALEVDVERVEPENYVFREDSINFR